MKRTLVATSVAIVLAGAHLGCGPSCEDLLNCTPYDGPQGGGGQAGAGGNGGAGAGGGNGGGGGTPGCGDGVVTPGEICLGSTLPETFTIAGTDLVTQFRTGDCDGDDDVDIIVLGTADPLGNSSVISAHRNNGEGTFSNVVATPISGGTLPVDMVMGDFDGLGQLDVAIPFGPMVNQFLQRRTGNGDCTFDFDQDTPLASHARSISAAFYDGDGTEDLVLSVGSPDVLQMIYSFEGAQSVSTQSPAWSLVGAQLDADAATDVAYLSDGEIVFRAGVSGSFGSETTSAVPGGLASLPVHMQPGDMDGDNIADLVVAHVNTNSISVMRNLGDGSFVVLSEVQSGSPEPAYVSVGDIDSDGDLDVLASNRDQTSLSLLLNDGSGTLVPSKIAANIQFESPLDVDGFKDGARLVDLNDDGALDIVFIYQPSDLPGQLYVLLAAP